MQEKIRNLKYIGLILAGVVILAMLQSCFTGIEGTGKIKLTKNDITASAPTAEDRILTSIKPEVINDWKEGRGFIVADEKLSILVENPSNVPLNLGDTIRYMGAIPKTGIDGGLKTSLKFEKDGGEINYIIDKPLEMAGSNVKATDLPMLLDIESIEEAKRLLVGKTVWTKTALWYDGEMEFKKGRKFEEVKITDILPGNSFFPIIIEFISTKGEHGRLMLNLGASGNESRSFSKLFSLKNPKDKYKNITPENWEAIQTETLRLGMTKEECKLSKGNPADVDMGHDYSNAMEIWYYPNGSYLRFSDGILIGFK